MNDNPLKKTIDELYSSFDDSFLELTREKAPEPEIEEVEEAKDDLADVKKEIQKKGYKITDVDVKQDQYYIEVRKSGKAKILKFSTEELRTPKDLLKSLSKELG